MKRGLTGRATLAFACVSIFLSIFVGVARAAEYVVDSTGDQPDAAIGSGGCKTSVSTCTLRAAIEESNATISAQENRITFEPGDFDGGLGGTITLTSPLPVITERVAINGSENTELCETEYRGLPGPCAGIEGPSGGVAFRVSVGEVGIHNLAISGDKTAVEAVAGSGFTMRDDWIGIRLDGSVAPVETGVVLGQESEAARIGGFFSENGDVFADDSKVGINVDGADRNEIVGNIFGVMPDGATPAHNGTDIEIGDAETGEDRVAQDNLIGQTNERGAASGSTCGDNGCNLISGAAGAGIDLSGAGAGEDPSTGSTQIFHNYLGLNAAGTATIPDAGEGILVGAAENVTVGGPSPIDRNLLAGGTVGVLAGSDADNLVIEGNWIGLDGEGTGMLDPPTAAGVALERGFGSVSVAENRISMQTGNAIESAASRSVMARNVIGEGVGGAALPGGANGVLLSEQCTECALVRGNSIADASESGIRVEGDMNHLYGNVIERSGAAGISLHIAGTFNWVFGTIIGGQTAAEENVISGSGGPAIQIVIGQDPGRALANLIARNRGTGNAGPFISLIEGAVHGIEPPAFSTSTETGASGVGAEPGNVIRVFRKANASAGEIEGFLAETTVDEDGKWAVDYPLPVPAGTMVAATQSREGGGLIEYAEGTSELSFATTTAPPVAPGGGGSNDGGGAVVVVTPPAKAVEPTPSPPAPRLPKVSILSRPPALLHGDVARFRFRSDVAGAHFVCQLDGGRIAACASSKTYRGLGPGRHLFKVWVVSGTGAQGPSPARWSFRVEARA